jgi:hypothetical protein
VVGPYRRVSGAFRAFTLMTSLGRSLSLLFRSPASLDCRFAGIAVRNMIACIGGGTVASVAWMVTVGVTTVVTLVGNSVVRLFGSTMARLLVFAVNIGFDALNCLRIWRRSAVGDCWGSIECCRLSKAVVNGFSMFAEISILGGVGCKSYYCCVTFSCLAVIDCRACVMLEVLWCCAYRDGNVPAVMSAVGWSSVLVPLWAGSSIVFEYSLAVGVVTVDTVR